ncbi:MAG: ABC transporter ATP-binding protein [Noviherbaspirillum sp.]
MLELQQVNTHYGNSHILQGVDLRINQGEVVCLLGRNGAGKTTTVSSIIGFARPSSGRILFKGSDITQSPVEKRARAGLALVPQGRRVFPLLTVEENLEIGKRPAPGGWSLERVYGIFPRLKERRGNNGANLSGGEQQMLAIGRALMANPSLILMDEPSEGLAPLVIEEMYRIIAKVAKEGMSILLVEHSLEQAIGMANRIYIMNKGAIVFETNEPGQLDDATRHRLLGVGGNE